jgi:hypothetical protein
MKDYRFFMVILAMMNFLIIGCASTNAAWDQSMEHNQDISRRQFDNTFDAAIFSASEYLISQIPDKSRVAIIHIDGRKQITDYVIDNINQYLVNSNKFIVIERNNLEHIQKEIQYQLSGEVDDDTIVSIGKQLGTEYIIAGNISYSPETVLKIVVHNIQTAQIAGNNKFPFNNNEEKYRKLEDFILDGNHLFSVRMGRIDPKYINEFKRITSNVNSPLEAYDNANTRKYLIQEYESSTLMAFDELRDFFTNMGFDSPSFRERLILTLDSVRSVFFDYGRSDGSRGYFVVRTY